MESLTGDLFAIYQPPCYIAHVVNDRGAWGRGFTAGLSLELPWSESDYRAWGDRRLGACRIAYGPGRGGTVGVVHLCAQRGLPSRFNPHPFQPEALVAALAAFRTLTGPGPEPTYCPPMGTGKGRGSWATVAPILWDHESASGRILRVCSLVPLVPLVDDRPPIR